MTMADNDLSDLNEQFQQQLRLEETPTDTGNAHRFARLCGGRVRYVPAEDNWLIWDGTRLRRDDENIVLDMTRLVCDEIRQHVNEVPDDERNEWRTWTKTSESVSRRKAMLELARSLPTLSVRAEVLDAQPQLLNTPGGTVNLDTLEIYQPRIEDLITRCTKTSLNFQVISSELLDDYTNTFIPEAEHWSYLTKILGSTLRGGNPFRLWLIIHGPTTSGKTQLTETIASALGDYSVDVSTSIFRANQDDKPRPDLLKALPARFVYAEEGSQAWELHGDHVKRLTGGGPIVARGMRSNVMVERIPSFTPLIICNDLPRVRDADTALRRRLKVVELGHSMIGKELIHKREEFRSDGLTSQALLTQLVLGCQRAYHTSDGLDDVPAQWVKITMDSFDELNHVSEFLSYLRDQGLLIDINTEYAPLQACWKASDLHSYYRIWVGMHGGSEARRQEMSLKELNKSLRGQGWFSEKSAGARWAGKMVGTANDSSMI
jgi:P4 family phage/plasmid primase-like protien